MVEAGLLGIRYGNNSHWDGLKIMRLLKLKKVFSVDEFIALLG